MSLSPPFWDCEDDEDPVIIEIISEERQKLPPAMFLDFGPPLPGRYGVDQLELMVQSPLRVFAYWEVKEATILTALRSIPVQDRQNFQLLLKWKEKDAARERCFDAGTTDNWWFDTLPEKRYQLELGLYWGEHGWLPLLASDELVTPRLALGPADEAEPPHTQAFLEDLVQQTGVGVQQSKAPSPAPPDAEQQLPEIDTRVVARSPSSERHPEELIDDISAVEPSRLRPTSSW